MAKSFYAVQQVIKIMVRIGSTLGFFPYTWDKKRNRLRRRSHWFWLRLYQAWMTAMGIYSVFLVYGCSAALRDPRNSPVKKARAAYVIYMNLGLLAGFWWNSLDGQLVLNHIFAFATSFQAKYGLEVDSTKLKWVSRVILFVYFFGITNAALVFVNPESHRLLSSLMSNPQNLGKRARILFFVLHLLIHSCQFFYTNFNMIVLLCYVCAITPILDRLRWNALRYFIENSRPTFHKRYQLTPNQIHTTSLHILVLQSAFTNAYGPWVFALTTYGVIMVLLNIFQFVAFGGIRPFVSVLGLGLIAMKGTRAAGDLYETSLGVQHSWHAIAQPTWFAKYVKAWRPARVPLGGFFFFDRQIWLTFSHVIVSAAANLIVTYSEEHSLSQ